MLHLLPIVSVAIFICFRWVSKIIRKRHDSSVTSVAWHPDNVCTDFPIVYILFFNI
jgi:hypothetical protein